MKSIALSMGFRRHTDVIFCGHLYMAPLAWLIARLKGAKLVVQMHSAALRKRASPSVENFMAVRKSLTPYCGSVAWIAARCARASSSRPASTKL